MKKVDAIIIGQGLAGTCMAISLIRRGWSVLVVDPQAHLHQGPANASRSAAGLFNPITGRKMVKTWLADELFAGLSDYYQGLESLWGARFYHEVPIYRPFQSISEQNDWIGADLDPRYRPVLQEVRSGSIGVAHIHDPYGGLLLRRSGYLDIPDFLDSARGWLQDQGSFLTGTLDEDILEPDDSGVTWPLGTGTIRARWAINCTGTGAVDSPFWSALRFRPVKGEWLKLSLSYETNYIVNRGVFMIPGEGHVRVGATYDHHQPDHRPTEKAKKQLLDKMSKIYQGEYRILEQRAGVRPATYDRRPFVGVHPKKKNLAILNGLGAKGVTLAPYFADQLAGHLTKGTPIHPAVDVNR